MYWIGDLLKVSDWRSYQHIGSEIKRKVESLCIETHVSEYELEYWNPCIGVSERNNELKSRLYRGAWVLKHIYRSIGTTRLSIDQRIAESLEYGSMYRIVSYSIVSYIIAEFKAFIDRTPSLCIETHVSELLLWLCYYSTILHKCT